MLSKGTIRLVFCPVVRIFSNDLGHFFIYIDNLLNVTSYTTVADVMLVASRSEHCFVWKRRATRDTAAIGMHGT